LTAYQKSNFRPSIGRKFFGQSRKESPVFQDNRDVTGLRVVGRADVQAVTVLAEIGKRKLTMNTPDLLGLRKLLVEDALNRSFKGGRLRPRDDPFGGSMAGPAMRWELMYTALLSWEYADPDGPFAGDERLRQAAVNALERNVEGFKTNPEASGDPMAGFLLVPYTWSLLSLADHMSGEDIVRLVDGGVRLYDIASSRGNLTHDYPNARALEAAACLNLHRLTGEKRFMDRCVECLDNLIARQYPCGAQPYHTGMWIWGRRPAQVYQYLSASMMLYVSRFLGREDGVAYVRRLMDYSLLVTNRRGECFVTTFEGLHKARTLYAAGRQWQIATVLGEERFRGLARSTYEIWADGVVKFCTGKQTRLDRSKRETFPFEALTEALIMGVREAPEEGRQFVPPSGLHALEDISTTVVHEGELDVCMSLLSGYSAFAEADCGDVKLFAVTPELTDEPTYRNAGTDSLRAYYQKPSEQIECAVKDRKTILRGWVYTKWEKTGVKDFRYLHNRRLEVTMTYAAGELLLEYQTVKNWQEGPVPSRLLFLLVARPFTAGPRLQIGRERAVTVPPAESDEPFFIGAPVGTVRFSSPDGSRIEIVPELSMADRITAERPPACFSELVEPGKPRSHSQLKPANEGSLRVAFEGPDALEKGRYRIRFFPRRS